MPLSRLNIARKLSIGFCCVLIAVGVMSALLFSALNSIEQAARADAASLKAADDLDRAMVAIAEQSRRAQGYVIAPNQKSARLYAEFGKEFVERIAQARQHAAGQPQILALIDKAEAAEAAWRREVGDPLFKLAQDDSASGKAVALAASDLSAALFDAASVVTTQAREKIGAWSAEESRIVDAMMSFGRWSLAVGGVATALLAVLIGWWFGRVIARPVADMAGAMNRLAAGDTATDVPGLGRADELGLIASAVQTFKEAAIAKIAKDAADAEDAKTWHKMDEERAAREAEEARQDQIAINGVAEGLDRLSNGDLVYRIETVFAAKTEKLRLDFNRAVEKLQEAMLGIRVSTKTIHSGSDEISAAADDLSRRTEQQAASLEETAATLDEITATVKATASGALHAQDVVSTAKTDADHSGEVVREAIAAVGGIEKSSQQIGQIIGVIDEIAFQTNLLALNAGVEAARAGDAGRGFAVVASEVRALAQRSAEAAKEIKGLISASTAQVAQGVDLVGQTGKALGRIVVQVAEIDKVVASIAASAQEQASALHQVNAAVNQMDQVTQQNAAMVEETTAAAHSLNRESEELARLLGRFEVGAAASEPARARQERPSPGASAQTLRPALKTTSTGRGAAARKIEPAPAQDSWEEF